MEPDEAARYDAYWKKNAPDFNTPNSKITHIKEHNGVLEKSTVIYDEFGRQNGELTIAIMGIVTIRYLIYTNEFLNQDTIL